MGKVISGVKGFIVEPFPERYWAKVDKRGARECWPWLGSDDGRGRGQFWLNGKRHRAPRIAWEIHNGQPFPPDLDACHSCDNPNCVNPEHIWPGSARDNAMDAKQKGRLDLISFTAAAASHNAAKTHCIHGHEFTAENTYYNPNGRHRKCRECQRIGRLRWEERVKRNRRAPLGGQHGQ